VRVGTGKTPAYRRTRRADVDRGRPATGQRQRGHGPAGARLGPAVDRPNLFIKIPATREGLTAITAVIGDGISVNVMLIFSLDRYREVIDAYLTGLEQAVDAGRATSTIASVASFFVSRVDTEIDARLDAIGTPEALALKGRAASPTPGWPTRHMRRLSPGPVGNAWPLPARDRNARCGHPPA